MTTPKSINQVLQGIKKIVNAKNEWVGNSLKAALVDVCTGMSDETIMRCARTLERMKVISRTKVRRTTGITGSMSPGIGVKVKLLRPNVTIVKDKGYFKIIDE